MEYAHTITITRPAAASSTDAYGLPSSTPDDTTVVDTDSADVQDMSYREVKDTLGDEHLDGAARIYFRWSGQISQDLSDVQIRDRVSATWEGHTQVGEVISIDRLDHTLLVKWLAVNP